MGNHIILIGFMGAGKTTVGKALAKKMGLELLDTDSLIEEQAGVTISEMFETQGEAAFRAAETKMLERLLDRQSRAVISVGGGLPLREENRALLKKLGTVVYLQVQPDTVLARLKGDTSRPLLRGGDAVERVNSLLAYRDPFYKMASHVEVNTDGKKAGQIAGEIIQKTETL